MPVSDEDVQNKRDNLRNLRHKIREAKSQQSTTAREGENEIKARAIDQEEAMLQRELAALTGGEPPAPAEAPAEVAPPVEEAPVEAPAEVAVSERAKGRTGRDNTGREG